MAEQIIGSVISNMWQIDDNQAGLITGSVAITNASVHVDVTVDDFVSVQASGAWIATSGQANVTQVTNPWIVLGSQAVTNFPSHLPGSVYQSTNPWITLGSQAITNLPASYNGSVYQATNPWVTLGSVAITNVVPVSGQISVTSENVPYDSNEQLTFVAGSPTSSVNAFVGGNIKTLTIKCDEDTYVKLGSATVDSNSFLVYAGEAISSNFQAGSISHLAKTSPGSIWVWGGR